ncbi:MAG: winged helix-turn-helix domain-containing protein, partial [Acidobacteria bacterium]|nr:winged helix-turn-helix domain-containing protein [Acidobacteriota bacterium]
MTYEFSGFRLEGAVLQHNGRVVPLMPKAVETLAVLVARAPAVVTKEELIAAVWPDTFVVESSLARNISLIRKALEDHAGPGDYIETLSKRGYRLSVPVTISETLTAPKPLASPALQSGSESTVPAPPAATHAPPAAAIATRRPYLLAALGL